LKEAAVEERWLVGIVNEEVFMFSCCLYHTYNEALVHVKPKEVILIGNALIILFNTDDLH
jgi:AAA+ superfamily predicted ATPase